ncbi:MULTISPECIES: acyl carrier protein [unclassified Micromonospora]|uniref:acyl carrier protein n=1 Tax=unclassified Micromonospora TaxID=2617518 RepID=UPI00331EE0E8
MASNAEGAGDLRSWLTRCVAEYLRRPEDEIDPTVRLAEYGLDSVYALALCGDIETHLDMRLSETLVWDHPTIDELTAHLTELIAEQEPAGAR